jgi:hypothetical protein
MPGASHANMGKGPPSQAIFRHFQRHRRLWLSLCVLLIVIVGSAGVYHAIEATSSNTAATDQGAQAGRTLPADVFIQSIVKNDGALGWHQLCPSVQATLSQESLVRQANAQRDTMARQGIKLTADFVGAHARSTGGEIRIYLLTAHWPNGSTEQRTFSVITQASGCVEDVQIG